MLPALYPACCIELCGGCTQRVGAAAARFIPQISMHAVKTHQAAARASQFNQRSRHVSAQGTAPNAIIMVGRTCSVHSDPK